MRAWVHGAVLFVLLLSAGHCAAQAISPSYEAFVQAVARDDAATLAAYLKRGMDPDLVDPQGDPMLLVAAREGHPRAAELLLQAGAHVNRRNAYGDSPIMVAALQGHVAIVKSLRARGAEINHAGWTPLLYAVTNGHDEVARFLLESGADVTTVAPNGLTALMMAVRGRHAAAVKTLLDYGVDPNVQAANGDTALKWARDKGYTEIVEILRAGGAIR